MTIDIRTVVFLGIIFCLICALFIVQLWHQNRRRFAGMGFWIWHFSLLTAAMVLIVLRGIIPDWGSIVLANSLIFAGVLLLYMGLERFVGRVSVQIHNYVLMALYIGAFIYGTYIQPDLRLRILVTSVGMLAMCFQCLWLLWRRVDPGMRALTFWAGLVFGGCCLVCIFRIVECFVGRHDGGDFFASGLFQALVLVSCLVLVLLLTYSLILMVNKRLFIEAGSEEEKFTRVFHSAPYAIMLMRASDDTMVDVNDSFVTMSGYERCEVVGKKAINLHIWEHAEDRAAFIKALSRNGKIHGLEMRFRNKRGEALTGLVFAETMSIQGETIIMASIGDITERKRSEEALRVAKADLEAEVAARTRELKDQYDELTRSQTAMLYMVEDLNRQTKEITEAQERIVRSEKLAVVGQLASSVAHELRNPLGVIKNTLYYLNMLELGKDDPDIKESLGIISAEIENSDKVIGDLLEFSRIKRPGLEPQDVNSIITETLNRIKPPANVKVVAELGANLQPIQADALQLQQVFYNLAVNAIQAMEKGGTLAISSFVVRKGQEADYIAVAFKDTGCGIPRENLQKIFEPLFSTKAKGTGLGLSVVASLVEGHKGTLDIESEVDKGSVFTVKLPVKP